LKAFPRRDIMKVGRAPDPGKTKDRTYRERVHSVIFRKEEKTEEESDQGKRVLIFPGSGLFQKILEPYEGNGSPLTQR
jgi:hypothetical protein